MNIVNLINTRILYADGQIADDKCSLPETTSPRFYPALREYLEPHLGGRAERVLVFHDYFQTGVPRYTDMFVHEMGALLDMPINHRASAIYRTNVLVHEHPPPEADDLPFIHGTAILFSRRVWF